MALDPSIILSGRPLDVLSPIQQGLNIRQTSQQGPIRNQLLQQGVERGQQDIQSEALKRQIFGAQKGVEAFKRGNTAGVIDGIREAFPGDDQRIQTEIAEFQADPQGYINSAQDDLAAFQAQQGGSGQTAGQREFKSLSAGLSADDVLKARRIELGLDPRATSGDIQTIDIGGVEHLFDRATQTVTPINVSGREVTPGTVAETESKIEGAKETAKQRAKVASASDIKEQSELGTQRGKIRRTISTAAQTARRDRPKIAAVRKALDLIATGKKSQVKAALGKFIPGMDISNEEVIQSQITQFVLDTLNKQTGTKTDFDFKKASEASAAFGKTTEGNKKILDILIRNLDRSTNEEKQFKAFKKGGGDALDFEFDTGGLEDEAELLFSGTLNREVSEQDIKDTLAANPGLTREALLKRLGTQ